MWCRDAIEREKGVLLSGFTASCSGEYENNCKLHLVKKKCRTKCMVTSDAASLAKFSKSPRNFTTKLTFKSDLSVCKEGMVHDC